ncbi:MAG: site-specific DNA-methyltransferase, partial [Actinomycetota bacterium]|nr:site-specific DNA-methyltransferase [Actinomycetota bacterium]
VLRDITERIVVASKGRFDRALGMDERRARGLPHEASISTDEFLEATLDVWEIRPESARRVGHPAPFPVELPQRLIELYTFRDDLVLDPFLGSGSTAVAALRTGRRYVGYDTDPAYVSAAAERVEQERATLSRHAAHRVVAGRTAPASSPPARPGERRAAQELAVDVVAGAGFEVVERDRRVHGVGIVVAVVARDADGTLWYFDVTGAFTSSAAGLLRTDVLWKCLGRASVLAARGISPVVLLSSDLPPRRSTGDRALHELGPGVIHDAVAILDPADLARLARYAAGGCATAPLPGFWAPSELHRGELQRSLGFDLGRPRPGEVPGPG